MVVWYKRKALELTGGTFSNPPGIDYEKGIDNCGIQTTDIQISGSHRPVQKSGTQPEGIGDSQLSFHRSGKSYGAHRRQIHQEE